MWKTLMIRLFLIFPNIRLLVKKRADFLLWSKVVQMMTNKDHLNLSGFLTILTYYASINRGMSKKVLKHFPNIIPYTKPTFDLPDQLNPYWVSGFTASLLAPLPIHPLLHRHPRGGGKRPLK
nr:hypothetical protein [Morchella crassipes]